MTTRPLLVASVPFLAAVAHAQTVGHALAHPQELPLGQFRYTMTLFNQGVTPIRSFRFAFYPGFFLMPDAPRNLVSPPGWTAAVLTDGQGYSVEFTAPSNAPLESGSSIAPFGFDTADSRAVMSTDSPFLPGFWTSTSYIFDDGTGPNSEFRFATPMADTACYANCDASTNDPALNVGDFACFLNRFAAGDTYANCDGSVTPPVLNINDFSCFLNRFAAGCT